MIQKSYNEVNKLYLVPTPIGNMRDITYRAVDVLNNVKIVYSEDTRVTKVLFDKYGIKTKLVSCHKFNEKTIYPQIVNNLKNGFDVALVTDRGTPLISDPGYIVSNEVIKNGFCVVSLPGPSALLPALNMSNIKADRFLFYGFLSSKQDESILQLKLLKNINFTLVLYESPHRLIKTLQNIKNIMGNKRISISREISKIHEEVFRGSVQEAIDAYYEPKGEFVIVIDNNEKLSDVNYAFDELKELISYGMDKKGAMKYISKKYDVSKNLLYNMLEENSIWS